MHAVYLTPPSPHTQHPRQPTQTYDAYGHAAFNETGGAGPGGALGALEGVSYLVVAGVFLWSIAKKIKTGTGLPGTLRWGL